MKFERYYNLLVESKLSDRLLPRIQEIVSITRGKRPQDFDDSDKDVVKYQLNETIAYFNEITANIPDSQVHRFYDLFFRSLGEFIFTRSDNVERRKEIKEIFEYINNNWEKFKDVVRNSIHDLKHISELVENDRNKKALGKKYEHLSVKDRMKYSHYYIHLEKAKNLAKKGLCEIWDICENKYFIVIPWSYEASVELSEYPIKDYHSWCVGNPQTNHYWKKYSYTDKSLFLYFFAKNTKEAYLNENDTGVYFKTAIQIQEDRSKIFWDASDRSDESGRFIKYTMEEFGNKKFDDIPTNIYNYDNSEKIVEFSDDASFILEVTKDNKKKEELQQNIQKDLDLQNLVRASRVFLETSDEYAYITEIKNQIEERNIKLIFNETFYRVLGSISKSCIVLFLQKFGDQFERFIIKERKENDEFIVAIIGNVIDTLQNKETKIISIQKVIDYFAFLSVKFNLDFLMSESEIGESLAYYFFRFKKEYLNSEQTFQLFDWFMQSKSNLINFSNVLNCTSNYIIRDQFTVNNSVNTSVNKTRLFLDLIYFVFKNIDYERFFNNNSPRELYMWYNKLALCNNHKQQLYLYLDQLTKEPKFTSNLVHYLLTDHNGIENMFKYQSFDTLSYLVEKKLISIDVLIDDIMLRYTGYTAPNFITDLNYLLNILGKEPFLEYIRSGKFFDFISNQKLTFDSKKNFLDLLKFYNEQIIKFNTFTNFYSVIANFKERNKYILNHIKEILEYFETATKFNGEKV